MEKKKIMVVDDAAMMRLIVGNILNDDPFVKVVDFAANGKQALEKLNAVKPDLILLDIEMPEMDGLEFLRHARLKSDAKIVMLTAVAPMGSPKAAMARALGADAVISKPSGTISYDLAQKRGTELIQVIYRLLGLI